MTQTADFTLDPSARFGTLRMQKEWFGPDGKLDASGRERVRKLMVDQADLSRLSSGQREHVLAQIDKLVAQLGTDGIAATSAKTIVDTIGQATALLEGLGRAIESLAVVEGSGKRVYELGAAGSLLSAGRALLETASMRLDHALNCDCSDPSSHEEDDASKAETVPPPAPEAPAP